VSGRSILLVPLGGAAETAIDLAPQLVAAFGVVCQVSERRLDPAFAFDAVRGQYRSDLLLHSLAGAFPHAWRVLGVATVDLFVPVLTFVFGEAELGGRNAVVSAYRLREEVYGLPPDEPLSLQRLLKEAAHELGHTFALRHCDDWTCVMRSSQAVEQLDLKTAQFCERCRMRLHPAMIAAT